MSSILKVDTINEVTSANGVTVDGLSIKDSKLVTANSVVTTNVTDANITSGKIADDAVTLAKMASGTDGNIISYDASGNPVAVATGSAAQVLTSAGAGAPPTFATATVPDNAITLAKMASGTDGNIISYDASGNPVAVATGNDGQVLTSTGAGSPPAFETLPVGGTNTPYFYASQSTATSIANASATKVTMDNEVLDSASAFASSRFTVPSGQGGKYFFHFSVALNTSANASIVFPILYVNGSEVANGVRIRKYHGGSDGTIQTYAQSAFYNASAGNYFEVYFYQNAGSAKSTYNSSQDTFFFGYKIIE